MNSQKQCPECHQVFKKNWWGIDAHWRSKHEDVARYTRALFELIRDGLYGKAQ